MISWALIQATIYYKYYLTVVCRLPLQTCRVAIGRLSRVLLQYFIYRVHKKN